MERRHRSHRRFRNGALSVLDPLHGRSAERGSPLHCFHTLLEFITAT
jgi:hypothetical protein